MDNDPRQPTSLHPVHGDTDGGSDACNQPKQLHQDPAHHSYVELHLHTAYSFLDGASQPEELVGLARELGYTALAITDHDNLAGAMAFAQYARAAGIQPIIGAEVTLAGMPGVGLGGAPLPPSVPPRAEGGAPGVPPSTRGGVTGGGRWRPTATDGNPAITHHLTLLIETRQGYANLCRLLTEANDPGRLRERASEVSQRQWMTAYEQPPVLPVEALAGRTEGLIALSGCRQGLLCQLIDAGRLAEAEAAARWLRDLFGPSALFLELQRHLVRGDTRRVARLVDLGERLGLPLVATGNVHYHVRGRHRLQDAMVAIKHRTTLEASSKIRRPNSEFFLRRPEEMIGIFRDLPSALEATREIADRCRAFDLTKDLGYGFPDFKRRSASSPTPAASEVVAVGDSAAVSEPEAADECHQRSSLGQQEDAPRVLEEFCWEALDARYPRGSANRPEAEKRLRRELRLIHKHRLDGFFLVYRDLLELAQEVAADVRGRGSVRGASGLPPGRGRGSSVSSIVCYLIGLSHIDPVKNDLFPGRFLNETLSSVPDIDLDFARDIREQLILRVYEHYGSDHAALVCSFATYHIRSAVRDVGKVLGLPLPLLDKLAKLSEGGSAATVRLEMERLPEFRGLVDMPAWRHLMDLSRQISQFPRHISQHVGGMIISSQPIVELVPVQPAAMPGRFICQWDKDSCDDARFIKVDFLALGMLSLVEECLELIWDGRGERVDLSQIDHDDPRIYDLICQGDTVGLFQIESRAQIQMLPRTQPRNLDDLAVQVAIVRPGPIVGGAVNPYVRQRERQRRGATDFEVDHPLLKDVLKDTLGVVLFQDQVMQVATALAGFTDGQADGLRRAMSRRRSHEAMEGFWEEFRKGAADNLVDEATARKVFDKLVGFSEFGFPKSHAAAFAVLAYQSAWLRFHYPAEYFCALFNNQPMGFYAPHVLVGDARRHGVRVLSVDVNKSHVECTVQYDFQGPDSVWAPDEESWSPVEGAATPLNPPVERGETPRAAAVGGEGSREEVFAAQESWSSGEGAAISLRPPVERGETPLAVGVVGEGSLDGAVMDNDSRQPGLPPFYGGTEGGNGDCHSSSSSCDRPQSPSEQLPPEQLPPESGLGRVRVGLGQVRALGTEAAEAIVAEREARGPFRSLTDFIRRMAPAGLKRPAIENLIVVGAFPSLGLNRRELLWQLGLLTQAQERGTKAKRPRTAPLALPTEQDMVERPPMSTWERIVADYHTLGLSPTLHPLGLMRAQLPKDIVPAERLDGMRDGAMVRVAGVVVCRQRPGTAQGFTFLLVEDETGLANVIIRPPLYERQRPVVRREPMVIVRGRLQCRDGNINVIAMDIEPLDHSDLPPLDTSAPPDEPRGGRPTRGKPTQLPMAVPIPAVKSFH